MPNLTPLLDYVQDHLWANPEENQQYQVKLNRLTDYFGAIGNFGYMNKWRSLPKRDTYFHVFTVGGLEPGYWNFQNHILRRNPLDRWVNLGNLAKVRGIQLDLYNSKGFQFSRSHAWTMTTYDGLTLIAFEKLKGYPMPDGTQMYFRTYGPSIPMDVGTAATNEIDNPYIYETMTYENPDELATFTARYSKFKAKPGFTGTFRNGVYFEGAPNAIPNIAVGDVVEFWHDPTVIRQEIYTYASLQDYYSELDKKRKLILHPPKRKGDFTLRYFDDNDYYIMGTGKYGLYLHRNDVTTVRQLTHADVAVADDAIRATCQNHKDLNDVTKVKIMVLVRKTGWEFQWPHEHQRIRYLYRMPDADILRALTGARANMPEWTANGLESGPVMSLLRKQYKKIVNDDAILSVGYNAATRVLSETPMRATYELGSRGIEVPITYQALFTAWEHDANGHLLGYWNNTAMRYYSPQHPDCAMVEFTVGHAARKLDYVVTNQDTDVGKDYDIRVYTTAYNIILGQIVGTLTDVTGDSKVYKIVDGRLIWVGLDKVNKRGVILWNRGSLAYTFTLDHLDHSLDFALTHIYEEGGLIFPITFANVDIWVNNKALVDKVDWIYKDKYCYIHNKEHLVEGAQTITVRAHGFSGNVADPNSRTELGFVDGGVIGRFDRYNLRADRVTRTVIGGSLIPTDEVPRAEREVPDDQWSVWNGMPYMVKHVWCPIKYVVDYNNYPQFQRSADVDKRVSDYLTKYLPKPRNNAEEITWEIGSLPRPPGTGVGAVPNLSDKWRLFSPFMNVVVNGIIDGLITMPNQGEGDTYFNGQDIQEAVKSFVWRLEFDPITRQFDRRYFAIMPYANVEKLTVTAKELIFIKQVNDMYLESACVIEGHFEVNNNVR